MKGGVGRQQVLVDVNGMGLDIIAKSIGISIRLYKLVGSLDYKGNRLLKLFEVGDVGLPSVCISAVLAVSVLLKIFI